MLAYFIKTLLRNIPGKTGLIRERLYILFLKQLIIEAIFLISLTRKTKRAALTLFYIRYAFFYFCFSFAILSIVFCLLKGFLKTVLFTHTKVLVNFYWQRLFSFFFPCINKTFCLWFLPLSKNVYLVSLTVIFHSPS